MRLNPPSIFIFVVSVLLAILALVSKFGAIGINVPRYLPHQEYWLAMIAYLVLMVGVIAQGTVSDARARHTPTRRRSVGPATRARARRLTRDIRATTSSARPASPTCLPPRTLRFVVTPRATIRRTCWSPPSRPATCSGICISPWTRASSSQRMRMRHSAPWSRTPRRADYFTGIILRPRVTISASVIPPRPRRRMEPRKEVLHRQFVELPRHDRT